MSDEKPTGTRVTSGTFAHNGAYVPKELYVCPVCGEYRGTVESLTADGQGANVLRIYCHCDDLPCRICGQRRVSRPGNLIDKKDNQIWHVAWFGYMAPCSDCARRERESRERREKAGRPLANRSRPAREEADGR